MMARISPWRTSNDTSVSAFTPPNASDTFSTDSRSWVTALSLPAGALMRPAPPRRVALGNEAAAHLLGAGQLAVVRVELLVQDQKAPDLRARHHLLVDERAIDLGDMLFQHVVD